MSFSYTCPNPDCGVTLKSPNRVATGKSVKCPKCARPFVPEPEGAGTLKLTDEPTKKPGGKLEAPKAAPAPFKKTPFAEEEEDSDESVKKGYGVVRETEAELAEGKKNKPKFTEVEDKFKKSARGPAQALLVMPSNLLTAEGVITVAGGIAIFIVGMFPLVFNDAPPGEEELEEAVATMLIGMLAFVWGGLICYGASQMQELGSYAWSMIGAIMGIVPLLAGLFALIMLQNPKVKAGFEEAEAGPDEEDDDDDDDEEVAGGGGDDDGGGSPAAKKKKEAGGSSKTGKKVAGALGGMLLGAVMGSEDDDGGDYGEDEDEPEEEPEEETDEADEESDEDEEDDRKKKKKKRR